MNSVRHLITAALAVAFAGCGADVDYRHATYLESKGQIHRAINAYEKFINKRRGDARVPEASFKLAELYRRGLDLCREAVPHYERAARAGKPWAEPAIMALTTCPDFFPLKPGSKWTYVDTLSGGENMRLEVGVVASSAGVRGRITGDFFAGEKKFREYDRSYVKRDWSIWEREADARARRPILQYPYKKGRRWQVRYGQERVEYRVVADNLTVRTIAGQFKGCLKIRSQTAGYPSWVFDYYCPDVGRVKTTVGAEGVENPNTELASYTLPKD